MITNRVLLMRGVVTVLAISRSVAETNITQRQNQPSPRLLLTDGYFWGYKKGGERFFFLTPALPAVNYPAR